MCIPQDTGIYYATIAAIVVTSLIYYSGYDRFRKYIRGTRFEESVRADDKIVAVTGANSGIGVLSNIFGVENDPKKEKKIKETTGQAITAELNRREVPRLDILICNAGVLRVPKFAKTVDGFERTWQCNYLEVEAHWMPNEFTDLLESKFEEMK
ncbi:hypothetical protein TELCIR_06669 [Teladorsagia circumcincta]|uniref:Oxidoreductase, short chain dehydrogenase/reductase family protein n=1 Tax=Teladorsagia circumcincta TaxID=45464 RepID=A0A2G9UMC6_TELCI|nr:hypothetical protein TELCIR_06669 [Teladorsagia circumcincta]